jgi:hypothetical protein
MREIHQGHGARTEVSRRSSLTAYGNAVSEMNGQLPAICHDAPSTSRPFFGSMGFSLQKNISPTPTAPAHQCC